jgi:hypothetical protein
MQEGFRRLARGAAYLIFALLCGAIALYAFRFLYGPYQLGNPLHARFALAGWSIPAHFFFAGLALLLAPLQVNAWLRGRWPRAHRVGGWLYAGCVLAGGAGALAMAPQAQGGFVTASAFTLLGIAWIGTTALGIGYAVAGDTARHRRWMWRSVALTASAVTLRLILGVGLGVLHAPFMPVYIVAAWGCWTINLALCEWLLWRHAARGTHSGSVPAAA